MIGKTEQSYYVLTTATFQAYRRLTVKCVRSRNVPIYIANAHAYMRMRIRTYARTDSTINIYRSETLPFPQAKTATCIENNSDYSSIET